MSVPRLDYYTDTAAEPAPASPSLLPTDAGGPPADEAVHVDDGSAESEPDEGDDEDFEEAADEVAPANDGGDPEISADAADDAADEKDAGVPVSASEYDLSAFGENDEVAKSFAVVAHKNGIPQKAMPEIAGWLNTLLAKQDADLEKADVATAKTATATLRKELGESNFTRTIDAAKQTLADLGPLGVQLSQARLPNGTKLTNDIAFVKALAKIAGEFTLPNDPAARIAAIEKIRDTNIQKYWDLKLDKELSQLQHRAKQPATKPTAPKDFGAPSSVTIEGRNYHAAADAVDAEIGELRSLMNTNIDDYMNKSWKNTGKTASARLLDLERKKTGAR